MKMSFKENAKKSRRSSTYDIYLGHLPKNIEEDKIIQEFSRFGEVVDILCRYSSGPYGYAIVKFKHKKDFAKILRDVDKITVDGYEMEVRSGKRSNENDSGSVQVKTVTFAEPKSNAYQAGGVIYLDPNVQAKDSPYGPFANNDRNAQQMPVMIEVMCTNVEDAVTFYGCPIFRCEELQNLSMKLNSICPNLVRLLRKPGLRKIYGALYLDDMSWYRCSIIQCSVPSKPGVCIVHYVDYGNIDEVSYTNMVDLPEPIKNVTPFAMKCILSNLDCNPNSNCDISYLHHLVNQRMSLCALTVWGIPEYHVLKCSCNGIDVVSELVRNGFAVYKPQKFCSKSPPPCGRSEKLPKSQENNKSKKPSAKTNAAKNRSSKSTCNGVEKQVNGSDTRIAHENIKNPKSTAADDIHLEASSDFIPKKIIKRGSDISNLVIPHLTGDRVRESVNQMLKVDCVISNLKLVNNIRNLVSPSSDDNLINNAVQLLLTEQNITTSVEVKDKVENTYKTYSGILDELRNCSDKALLPDLKQQKETQMAELRAELNKFIENFDISLLEKRKTIQKMITDLESNSNAWMNVYLPSQPATIDDLLAQYNKEKECRWNIIQATRENTNDKHKKFLEFLGDFQKEFFLNLSQESSDTSSYQLKNVEGKKGSWAVKFEEALAELGSALDEEMKTCTVNIGKSCVSVIQCILERLDIPKERIDAECELYEKYKSLYDDLNHGSGLQIIFNDLAHVQDKKENLILLYCASDSISMQTEDNILLELHNALLKEDIFMELLVKASAQHFPELVLEHPHLNITEYQENCLLLKPTWLSKFFPVFDECFRVEISYISKFVEEPVVIKEFEVSSEAGKTALIKKAVIWNEIKSKSLVQVQAFYNKDEKTVCALIPSVWKTLYDSPLTIPVDCKEACHILQQVLVGLRNIHSRGIAHGAIHPLAILHNAGDILLDFNNDLKSVQDKLCIKGLNFQVPNEEVGFKSADMYRFGCLVLWVLFPNLSFTSTKEGVPNLAAFQSIFEEFLSTKDFAALSALLSANPDLRPSSGKLLSSGFLKEVQFISNIVS